MPRLQLNYGSGLNVSTSSVPLAQSNNIMTNSSMFSTHPYNAENGAEEDDAPPPMAPPPTTALPFLASAGGNAPFASSGFTLSSGRHVIAGTASVTRNGVGGEVSSGGAVLTAPKLNYAQVIASSGETQSASSFGHGVVVGGGYSFTPTLSAETATYAPLKIGGGIGRAPGDAAGGLRITTQTTADFETVATRWGSSAPATQGGVTSPDLYRYDDGGGDGSDEDDEGGHVNLPSAPRPTYQFRRPEQSEGSGFPIPSRLSSEGLVDDGLWRRDPHSVESTSALGNNAAEAFLGAGGGTTVPRVAEEPPMPPFPFPDEPVVPAKHQDQLMPRNLAIDWTLLPSSQVVTCLLVERGATLPVHTMLYEYHMAQSFLECLDVLSEGSYFVYYQSRGASPKERYFRVEMGEDGNGRRIPFLNWYIHKNAVGLADRVPLSNLVGVTPNCRSPVFRPHMINAQTIVGCYSGDTRSRLSSFGCFTLWFWDPYYAQPRSVDLLTTSPLVHQLWVMTMKGVLSVNSVSIGIKKGRLAGALTEAQRMLDKEFAEESAEGSKARKRKT